MHITHSLYFYNSPVGWFKDFLHYILLATTRKKITKYFKDERDEEQYERTGLLAKHGLLGSMCAEWLKPCFLLHVFFFFLSLFLSLSSLFLSFVKRIVPKTTIPEEILQSKSEWEWETFWKPEESSTYSWYILQCSMMYLLVL